MLCNKLKEMYDRLRLVHLFQVYCNRIHLRLQEFKSVCNYNSELFKIRSKLLLCGQKITNADMLEKILSIFRILNMFLRSNIERKILKNILNSSHVFLMSNKIMGCWWKTTNPDQLKQNHSLKENIVNFNRKGSWLL